MGNLAENQDYWLNELSKIWDSFEYFLDEYVWIEDKENKIAIKLELWPEQRKIVNELINSPLLILLKTRQIGLTWLAAAVVLWLGIKNPLFLSVIISASEDHAIEFLNRVYFIMDRLPTQVLPIVKSRTKQVLVFAHQQYNKDFKVTGFTESTIKSMPTIEMGAESKTPNVLIIDEAHTIRNVGQIFSSSYPGIEQAKGQVIVIANSVKSGAGWGWVRDLYTTSMKGINKFKRIFLPWMAHPLRPANFRKMMTDSGMSPEDVIEHYPESEAEAIATALGSYFGDALKRHSQTMPGDKGRLIKNKEGEIEFQDDKFGPVEIWRHPYHLVQGWDSVFYTQRYAIGSDISEGLGNTYSTAFVKDRRLDEFVAKIRSNRIDAVDWAEQLRLLSLYYGNHVDASKGQQFKISKITALTCVEVNGSGQTTVKELIKKKVNQYVRIVPDVIGSGLTHQYGWPESAGNKYELANDLKQWFKTMKGRLYDGTLIDQCSIFIRYENGRLGHEEGVGKLDDDVIGAGLAIQADLFLGEAPKKIIPPLTGWRYKQYEESKKAGVWAL